MIENPVSTSDAMYDASYEPVDENDSSSKIKLRLSSVSNILFRRSHSSPSLPFSIVSSPSLPVGKCV